MQSNISEPDWKRFRNVHPIALARFADRSLAEFRYLLTEPSKPAVDRFWDIAKAVDERQDELRNIFDDLRRSTAIFQLAVMRRLQLVSDEEFAQFGQETRDSVTRLLSPM